MRLVAGKRKGRFDQSLMVDLWARTDSVESAKDEIEESNSSSKLCIEFQDDGSEGTAGFDEFLVAPGPVGVQIFGDLWQLRREEELSKSH